jgi:hypothetical protein
MTMSISLCIPAEIIRNSENINPPSTMDSPPHSLAPSSWPLNGIPTPILDLIIDYLADMAVDRNEKRRIYTRRIDLLCNRYTSLPKLPAFVPFSDDLRSMSLTCHAIRDNVFRRKICQALVVKSSGSMKRTASRLGSTSRSYVR